MKSIIIILNLILISSIIILSLMLIPLDSYAEEMSNKDLSKIVNNFLCSDDIQKMSDMVEYPVFFIKENRLFDEQEFVKGVKFAQKEDGIYKLGKKCNNFQWDIKVIINDKSGHNVFVVSSIDKYVEAELFINKNGKIVGIIGR